MFNRNQGCLTWVVIGLVVVVVVGGITSIRIVDQAKTCAVLRLGKVIGAAEPGLHFVSPFITKYDCFRSQQTLYQTSKDAIGDADYVDYPVEIKTSDGQTAFVEFNIGFHVDAENVEFVRSDVASTMDQVNTRVIANFGRSVPRDVAPEFTAESLYGVGRVDFEKKVGEQLEVIFASRGITMDSFSLRDVNFNPDYENAIEQQQIAREYIQTAQFQAESAVYEAQREAELAKGAAQATIERAKGNAEAVRINAAAEAEAIRLRGAALRENPEILKLEFINALDKANWMLIPWEDVQPFLPLEDTDLSAE